MNGSFQLHLEQSCASQSDGLLRCSVDNKEMTPDYFLLYLIQALSVCLRYQRLALESVPALFSTLLLQYKQPVKLSVVI